MNIQNATLTNVFSKALIANSNAPRYARATFAELVSATMLSKSFQHAIKAAENLFGIAAEDKVIKRKLKHVKKAKVSKRHTKKHAKVAPVAEEGTPKPKRGRPKGSKNRPKPPVGIEPEPAQSMPLVAPDENVNEEELTTE